MSGGFGAKNVGSPQRQMQLLSLKKTGLGTPVISGSCANFCTITDNGVGDYTINFVDFPFAQIPEVVACVSTADMSAQVGTVTTLAAQILTTDLAGTSAEADFHLMIFGSMARDLIG